MDLIIRRAQLPAGAVVDIGISGERIAAVEPQLPPGAGPEYDAEGRLVVWGYVDPHMHLDKALLADEVPNRSGTLDEAIAISRERKATATREEIAGRARVVARLAIEHGVRAIRTHVDVDTVVGLEAVRALLEVREELKDDLIIQIVAFPQEGLGTDEDVVDLLKVALEAGADVLGGLPARDPDPGRHLDRLFGLARAYDVPLDMHVDESDDPDDFTLPLVIERTRSFHWEGRVTVDHLVSLSAVDHGRAEAAMAQLADLQISVVTLPSSNLYLQGRGDRGLIRRGTTRIGELLRAGVRVVAGGDNLRDPFNPFGNANPIETAWLLAHVAHMGGTADLTRAFAMVTDEAAATMGILQAHVAPGAPADLIVLEARSAPDAVVSLARPRRRVRRGVLQ